MPAVKHGAGPARLGIDSLLHDIRCLVMQERPHLGPLLDTFGAEARFGRAFIEPSLRSIKRNAKILEVGAGLMILSCQLVREGYGVTALEPVGHGFSHFSELQQLIVRFATHQGILPVVLPISVESLKIQGEFDFAFSINVMEHIDSVPAALRNVTRALRPGRAYRFTCPNYTFPYEPHFNIPTLFSKRLTEAVFGKRIFSTDRMPEPEALWRSLNWITVHGIKRAIRGLPDVSVDFNRTMLEDTLARMSHDEVFAARRSLWVRKIVNGMVALGLHRAAGLIPANLQPVIDCTARRVANGHRRGGQVAHAIGKGVEP